MHADNSEPWGGQHKERGNRFNLSPGQRLGFPCGTSLPWEVRSWICLLPLFPELGVSVCPSRGNQGSTGHSVWDVPCAGDGPEHPDPVCVRVTAGATPLVPPRWFTAVRKPLHAQVCPQLPTHPLCVPALSCSPTCLPHETFPQQDAEKCL